MPQSVLIFIKSKNSLPKKIKDFDKERFKEDMKAFFDEQKLLVKKITKMSGQ